MQRQVGVLLQQRPCQEHRPAECLHACCRYAACISRVALAFLLREVERVLDVIHILEGSAEQIFRSLLPVVARHARKRTELHVWVLHLEDLARLLRSKCGKAQGTHDG